MEIAKINDNTWRIEDMIGDLGVRFFLLAGETKALMIDSGMQIKNVREIASELTPLPVELLNTHGDIDHVGGNNEFDGFYMDPSEASNYYKTQNRTGNIIPVSDGDIIDLGNRRLEIIRIPGHTPGSIAVLDENNRALFSGDPIQDGNIYMFGIQREMRAYLLSLKKLEKYAGRFDTIYPSHGSCPVTPDIIPALYEGAERVLAGKAPGSNIELYGTTLKRYDIGVAGFLCDF